MVTTAAVPYAEYDLRDVHDEEARSIANNRGQYQSDVQDFYAGSTVLLTGVTGFLGKVILEKLVRSCSKVKMIFLLIRKKNDLDPATRLDRLLNEEVFKVARKQNPRYKQQIRAFYGDISVPGMDFNPVDRDFLVNHVDIIIHSAATVRFDENLVTASKINVRGSVEMIKLARDCHQLKAFTYISTSFAHGCLPITYEKFYDPPMEVDEVLQLMEHDQDIVSIFEPKIMGNIVNTYIFTKSVAESAYNKYGRGLPVCIVRPAVVFPAYKEPLAGWVEKNYKPTFLYTGTATGIIRVQLVESDAPACLVPVDLCVNSILVATADTGRRFLASKEPWLEIPIYNYADYNSEMKVLTWKDLIEPLVHQGPNLGSSQAVWYYSDNRTSNIYVFKFWNFFSHLLPAIGLDLGRRVLGKPTKYLKIYKALVKYTDVIRAFSCNVYRFHNVQMLELWKRQSYVDQVIFPFDMTDLDWGDYFENMIRGLRAYVLGDNNATVSETAAKYQRLKYADYTLKSLLKVLFLWLFYQFILYFFF